MMSNELADSIFDPRGKNRFYELQLAPRPSLQALRDGKVLFFDNTKLDFCHYREIFTRLETVLNEHGIHRIEHVRQSVRGAMTEQIRELADKLARTEVQAAVVALADMGTHPKMDLDRSHSGTEMMPYHGLGTLMAEYERQSIGDGLPVIPPTPARFAGHDPMPATRNAHDIDRVVAGGTICSRPIWHVLNRVSP